MAQARSSLRCRRLIGLSTVVACSLSSRSRSACSSSWVKIGCLQNSVACQKWNSFSATSWISYGLISS